MRRAASMLSAHAQNAPAASAAKTAAPSVKTPTLFVLTYSHLDTEWCWTFRNSILEYIPNTLRENFALFEKYPDYTFNWTGANRYQFMKDYYPADYARLKTYVAQGRWVPTGSAWDENDALVPSPESIIRSVLYANRWFDREFGITSNQYLMPDTFGFPASLPTVLSHCGLQGFSTKKLTYGAGAAVGVPFNVGKWVGVDGQSVFAALNPGDYRTRVTEDLTQSAKWQERLAQNGEKGGVFWDLMYHGNGDVGGSPGAESANYLQKSLQGTGPVRVRARNADEFFRALFDAPKSDTAHLPTYKGDLLLIEHSAGSINSGAAMKRWNHRNERLADAAERASVSASVLCGAAYPGDRLTQAWQRFLGNQMHDILPGTSIPSAYTLSWNDEIIALNQFADVEKSGIQSIAASLNTQTNGVPLIVYNPLGFARTDVVTADVVFPAAAPQNITVYGPDNAPVPTQILSRRGNRAAVLFLARVPSVGCAVFSVRTAQNSPVSSASPLRISPKELENARYRVVLDANGDIAQITDKIEKRDLLSAPMRLAFLTEKPKAHPAWNMDWEDRQKPPAGYVDGQAKVTVLESGLVRVALQVERTTRGSHFTQIIRLSAGEAQNRVEFQTKVDWHTGESSIKAVFPLTVSNINAAYNEEVGVVERGNNDPKKYEVPAHEWFDLTSKSGEYGVSILNEAKYGSDKPNDNTLRLTLLYTPGVRDRFQYQGTQDWGHHEISYALQGHKSDWRNAQTGRQAARFNQPLAAFQTEKHGGVHGGTAGHSFSLLRVDNPSVRIAAIKKAEDTNEIVVRFFEETGTAQKVRLRVAARVVQMREINGQEQTITSDDAARLQNGTLVFAMRPFRPRAFALTLKPLVVSPVSRAKSVALALPFNLDAGHAFDETGSAYPAERLPQTLASGNVAFRLRGANTLNAVACDGQAVALPPASAQTRTLHLIAASADADTRADFGFVRANNQRVMVSQIVQKWDGYIGQWDTRIWKKDIPEQANFPNELASITPGFIKRAPIAWYADHKKLADGKRDAYHFCYLFRYEVTVPKGAKTWVLPKNKAVRIFAATITDGDAPVRAAHVQYD